MCLFSSQPPFPRSPTFLTISELNSHHANETIICKKVSKTGRRKCSRMSTLLLLMRITVLTNHAATAPNAFTLEPLVTPPPPSPLMPPDLTFVAKSAADSPASPTFDERVLSSPTPMIAIFFFIQARDSIYDVRCQLSLSPDKMCGRAGSVLTTLYAT